MSFNKASIGESVFTSIAFSFAFQPTNLRLAGYSLTLILMLIFFLLSFYKIKDILLIKNNLIIYPILIYLIVNLVQMHIQLLVWDINLVNGK